MASTSRRLKSELVLLKESGELLPYALGGPPLPPPGATGPAASYPILTEEVGYPPLPLTSPGAPASRTGGSRGGGGNGSLGVVVNRALQDVLGWKIKPDDAAGFTGALTQSFQLNMVEGAVVPKWTPRSYAVQTDLSGGVTGAQASIYTMAKTLLDQMLPLIDGLYALDPASDAPDAQALKDLATSQLTNLTTEIGYLGGPRVMRVHQYFQMLLGIKLDLDISGPRALPTLTPEPLMHLPPGSPLRHHFNKSSKARTWPPANYWMNPDTVLGSFGDLRDELGLAEGIGPRYVNTVSDEQNVTNFRIVVDYANSLLSGWINSIQYFASPTSPFLGTQLVVISRQLGVISETVDEVRFVLDSVFIGPAQRQTMQLIFNGLVGPAALAGPQLDPVTKLPPIYLEDLLQWMQNFVGAEAQDVIQNGGKLGLGEDFTAMIAQLYTQAFGLYLFAQQPTVPSAGLSTPRVQQSLYKLATQLADLCTMTAGVGVPYIPPRK
jgi:hypothetical protein